MLKILLFSIVVAIAAVLGYAATRPDTFRIQRTARIDAAREKVFPLINDLRSGEQWSPYYRKDPGMKGTYTGSASGPGAAFEFAGNKDVGSGRLTITDSAPPGKVTMRLQMHEPFAADNVVEFPLRVSDFGFLCCDPFQQSKGGLGSRFLNVIKPTVQPRLIDIDGLGQRRPLASPLRSLPQSRFQLFPGQVHSRLLFCFRKYMLLKHFTLPSTSRLH